MSHQYQQLNFWNNVIIIGRFTLEMLLFFLCQTSMLNWIQLPCVFAYSVCWIYEMCFWYLVFASWQSLVNLVVICGNLVISHLFWSAVSYHERLLNWNYCLSCYFIPLMPQLFFYLSESKFYCKWKFCIVVYYDYGDLSTFEVVA